MEKLKIAVLAGGYSPERDVSLSSGSLIANSLIRSGHRAVLVDSYLGVEADEITDDIFDNKPEYKYTIPEKALNLEEIKALGGGSERIIGKNVMKICRRADLVFVALHGGAGEDGRIQAILEAYGIKHTGPKYESCLLAMDKNVAKLLFRSHGIPTPEGVYIKPGTPVKDAAAEIRYKIGVPCVIKPSACGSSVGVTLVEEDGGIEEAYEAAAFHNTGVIAERLIYGREIQVGMLDGKALPPIEIIPDSGFYDFKNKYDGHTKEVTPAPIPDEATTRVQDLTLMVCEALGLTGYSRIDFIYEKGTGNFFVLEANALPGMTPASLLPQEAAAAGIDYDSLCEKIASLALEE